EDDHQAAAELDDGPDPAEESGCRHAALGEHGGKGGHVAELGEAAVDEDPPDGEAAHQGDDVMQLDRNAVGEVGRGDKYGPGCLPLWSNLRADSLASARGGSSGQASQMLKGANTPWLSRPRRLATVRRDIGRRENRGCARSHDLPP